MTTNTHPTTSFSAPSLAVLIAAGGSSARFGGGNKLFAHFQGEPLFIRTLKNLLPPEVHAILAVPAGEEEQFRQAVTAAELTARVHFVHGGATRSHSVYNALQAVCGWGNPPEFVAIHDGARPLASQQLLLGCLQCLQQRGCDGVIAAHPVTDTIHQVDANSGAITATPPRHTLWGAETPQLFRRQVLERAFREVDWQSRPFTDEAALVAALPSTTVTVYENTAPNPKITYRHDLPTGGATP